MQVKIKQGVLEGDKKQSVLDGKEFYYFLNIPYAEPPVGNLRFRPPVPAKSWKGVRDATVSGNSCVQIHFRDKILTGSEDCLYLNVYTPDLPNPNGPLKPVMVYIHGGAFCMGSGLMDSVSPDYLINHDVILVSINYRLHILGFLNLNIPDCCGNFGLKDQHLALKWVKENIQSFGGDAENITLVGESAGATSVQYHMISPKSKGLMKRAIVQSGSVLAPWAITENPEQKGFNLGKLLGFDGNDPEDLLKFLKSQSVEKLCEAAQKLDAIQKLTKSEWDIIFLQFLPSVEKITKDAFIPDHPKNLIKKADPLPVICGVDEIEGVLILADLAGLETVDKVVENLIEVVKYNIPCHSSKYSDVAKKIKQFYFGDDVPKENKVRIRQYMNLYSDIFFRTLYESFEYITKSKEPVYFYEFTFSGTLSRSKINPFYSLDAIELTGACHSDELGYLFYSQKLFPQPNFNGPEKKVIQNVCTLWTNFARTGNPTPKESESKLGVQWRAFDETKPTYLNIGADLKLVEGRIWNERTTFWMQLMKDSVA